MTSSTASHISAPPGASSTRSYQRIKRVMRDDMDLAELMLEHVWCKPGTAEKILTNPRAHRAFRKMIKSKRMEERRR
jgi:hypothetical protein